MNFGIILAKSCLVMISAGLDSDCPTYEDIAALFPDTSEQVISGKFGYYDGIYQRSTRNLNNHYQFYKYYEDPIMFIDPPSDIQKRIKTITIHPSLDDYLIPGESYNAKNYTITMGKSRQVRACTYAEIDGSQWFTLLGDTIQYMTHGCDSAYTFFNDTKTVKIKLEKHDITTSYKYKLENWFRESIEACGKKICIGIDTRPPP